MADAADSKSAFFGSAGSSPASATKACFRAVPAMGPPFFLGALEELGPNGAPMAGFGTARLGPRCLTRALWRATLKRRWRRRTRASGPMQSLPSLHARGSTFLAPVHLRVSGGFRLLPNGTAATPVPTGPASQASGRLLPSPRRVPTDLLSARQEVRPPGTPRPGTLR